MNQNPYAPPNARVEDSSSLTSNDFDPAGFWLRVLASIIDSILLGIITVPLLLAIYGSSYYSKTTMLAGPADFLVSWVLPIVLTVWFWSARQATPGKMLLSLKIIDAETAQPIGLRQSIIRYLGYFVSGIALGLGFLWVAWDARKQGWHDKIAGTLVVRVHR